MARLRNSSFRSPVRGLRRKTSWALGPFGDTGGLSANGATVFGVAAQADLEGMTIVRIRGELLVHLFSNATAGDGFPRCAVGLCIVTENAAGVGVTAIPSPIADLSWDGWMWHKMFSLVGADVVGAAVVSHSVSDVTKAARFEIDSKAMRKIKNTDLLIGVAELADEIGTAVVEMQLNTRQLVKLS